MDLTNQTQITIQNEIFTLGSPVTHADTLDQLLGIFQQKGIQERPIVIINPISDSLPDLTNLLENYIENAMQGFVSSRRTSYMFQNSTDEELEEWARLQHQPGGQSVAYLLETAKIIREQSRAKYQLDVANARRNELWRLHCLNPDSDEGSAEYSQITYVTIPQLEKEISEITERLKAVPADLPDLPTEGSKCEEIREIEEPVIELSSSHRKPCSEFLKSSNLMMPLSIAKKLVDKPENSVFNEQQNIRVDGYETVPLEYLIALGITLYADGNPIVYTRSGEFMRVGTSSVGLLVQSYWFPKPKYMELR